MEVCERSGNDVKHSGFGTGGECVETILLVADEDIVGEDMEDEDIEDAILNI